MRNFHPTVIVENSSGERCSLKPRHSLRAYLAMCEGYEHDFKVTIDEEGESMIDAECNKVPSIPEMCLRSPELVGEALEWMCENLKPL